MRHFAVKGTDSIATVRFQQNGAARGFATATRLHADIAVFHQIQTTDTMLAANLVQLCQQTHAASCACVPLMANQITTLEFQIQISPGVRRSLQGSQSSATCFLPGFCL